MMRKIVLLTIFLLFFIDKANANGKKSLWHLFLYSFMPFTGPKMFWAGPNFLCQTKRWFAFSKIGFCAGTKVFEEALNAVKFWGWLKKFGPTQNILGPVKGQGINFPVQKSKAIVKFNLFLLTQLEFDPFIILKHSRAHKIYKGKSSFWHWLLQGKLGISDALQIMKLVKWIPMLLPLINWNVSRNSLFFHMKSMNVLRSTIQ